MRTRSTAQLGLFDGGAAAVAEVVPGPHPTVARPANDAAPAAPPANDAPENDAKPVGDAGRVWTIYCHTCKVNGKRYVGLTRYGWEFRWNAHLKASQHESPFYFHRAIRKYGHDAFDHFVLGRAYSIKDAKTAEAKWISCFRSNDPTLGYNMTRGGDGWAFDWPPSREEMHRQLQAWMRSSGRKLEVAEFNRIRHDFTWPSSERFKRLYGASFGSVRDAFAMDDLVGRIVGKLLVTKEKQMRSSGLHFMCICSCHDQTRLWVPASKLKSGTVKGCKCASVEALRLSTGSRRKHYIVCGGEAITLDDLAKRAGIKRDAAKQRLRCKKPWTPDEILCGHRAHDTPPMHVSDFTAGVRSLGGPTAAIIAMGMPCAQSSMSRYIAGRSIIPKHVADALRAALAAKQAA